LGCKYIGIKELEFVAKVQLLCVKKIKHIAKNLKERIKDSEKKN